MIQRCNETRALDLLQIASPSLSQGHILCGFERFFSAKRDDLSFLAAPKPAAVITKTPQTCAGPGLDPGVDRRPT